MKRHQLCIPLIAIAAATGCLADNTMAPAPPPEHPPLGGTLTPMQTFLTSAQAQDVANALMLPFSSPVPAQLFNDARFQLRALYPDITFEYNPADVIPNVYAVAVPDTPKVVVSGGFARLAAMQYEGFVMALASGAASFKAGTPKNAQGFSPLANADYYAFQTISRSVWFGNVWMQGVDDAMQQWQAVFALVAPANAGGVASDPANNPSLACRVQIIQAAVEGAPLPACAVPAARPN
jgi:hypothetical protein